MFIGLWEALFFFNNGTLIEYREERFGEERRERNMIGKGEFRRRGQKRSSKWLVRIRTKVRSSVGKLLLTIASRRLPLDLQMALQFTKE